MKRRSNGIVIGSDDDDGNHNNRSYLASGISLQDSHDENILVGEGRQKLKKVKLDKRYFSELDLNTIVHIMEYYSFFMEHTFILRDLNSQIMNEMYAVKKLPNNERRLLLLFPTIELEIYDFQFEYTYSFPIANVKHLKLIDRRPLSHTSNKSQSSLYPIHRMISLETFEVYSNILNEDFIGSLSELKYLKSLFLKSAYEISLEGLRKIMRTCPSLQCLRLGNKGFELVDDNFCQEIVNHPNMKELHLPYHNISSKGLEELVTANKLQILNLSENQEMEDPDLSCLSNNQYLTDLNLSYNKIGDKQIRQIVKNGSNVKYLNLCTLKKEISPKSVKRLLEMNLINLSIRHLKPAILDSKIFDIKSKLSKLDLSLSCGDESTPGDEIALNISRNFVNLNFLSMRRCYLTDTSAIALVQMQSLKHLNISFNKISDETLRRFVQDNLSIETFYINNNSQLTSGGYKLLAYHPTLTSLRMSGKIGNDSLIHLFKNSPQLKYLHIDEFKRLSNLPFEYIGNCETLEQLVFNGCYVSDEAAQMISNSSSLNDLSIISPKKGPITNNFLKALATSKLQTMRLPSDNFYNLTEGVKELKCNGKQVIWQ